MKPQILLATMVTALLTQPANAKFEVHEWGTFTSLVGSDGLTQHGMYHEDEALPSFVHPFGFSQYVDPFNSGDPENCKNFKMCFSQETLRQNVITQKMETPVIYFYGKPNNTFSIFGNTVSVNVKFPEGVITETYPGPSATSPQNSTGFVALKNGDTTFQVEVLDDTSTTGIPFVDAANIYSHARNTKSQLVRANNEKEKFIFYRGIGRFQPKISIKSSGANMDFRSTAENKPQAAFLIGVNQDGSSYQMYPLNTDEMVTGFGGLQVSGKIVHNLAHTFPHQLKEVIKDSQQIRAELSAALVKAGLFADEAKAMLDTWENGYLKVPGLRLLYILPRAEVESILPMTITPAADVLQRAFIARIEIMTDNEENGIISDIVRDGAKYDIAKLGRFAEPKLRRVQQVYMNKKSGFDSHVANIISDLVNKSVTFSETTSSVIH